MIDTARLRNEDCRMAHSDLVNAADEIDDLRRELENVYATRKFWPFHVREAIRSRNTKACAVIAQAEEDFITHLQGKIDTAEKNARKLSDAVVRVMAALERLIFKPPNKSKSEDGLEAEIKAAIAQAREACK